MLSLVVAVHFVVALRRVLWFPPVVSTRERPIAAKLSVIIPARNEEEDVAQALQSVLDQVGVEIEVFVINDHSSDRTGAIVDAIARADCRVTVLHNPELPPGWLGKSNAMHQAAALASGTHLIFTDADIIHAPTSFAAALTELESRPLDFLSLFPEVRCVSFWENVLLPVFVGGVTQYATAGIEESDSGDALAAGAFMLVRAEVFRTVGGFASIRNEMFDDVSLARLIKRQGYRVGFRACPQLLQVRLFKGNRHAFWGMTKNILEILGGRLWLAPFVMLLPFLVFWTPLLAVVIGLVRKDPLLAGVATATYGIQYGLLWLGRRIFVFRPIPALAFPLVAVVVVCCMARAFYFHVFEGAVRWRGRTVRVRGAASTPEP